MGKIASLQKRLIDRNNSGLILPSLCICRGEKRNIVSPSGEILATDCGEKHYIDKADVRLRDLLIKEFVNKNYLIWITSGFRCETHNRYCVVFDKTGATKLNSLHTKGMAVDFVAFKNGKPLTISQCAAKAEKLLNNIAYKFDDEDWFKIFPRYPNLTKKIRNQFFIKCYNIGEGRDPDNLHEFCYFHIDFRGISLEDPDARPYYQRLNK